MQVFCQMSGEEGRWDCARIAVSNPSPTPEQLPESNAAPLPVPAPAVAEQQPPADLPDYLRLAYQPAAPIALADLPPDFYAIQLLAMDSRSELETYVEATGVPGMSAAPVERNGGLYYVLLLGVYESRADAEAAAQDLPAPFADRNPWIRSLGSLQAAMARGAALHSRPQEKPVE
jgi:DamX protein